MRPKKWIVYLGLNEKEVSLRRFILNNHGSYRVFGTESVERAVDWIKHNHVHAVITTKLGKRTIEALTASHNKKHPIPHLVVCGSLRGLISAGMEQFWVRSGKQFTQRLFEALKDATKPKRGPKPKVQDSDKNAA